MRLASLFALVVLSCGSVTAGENWPQFRGPTGDGQSTATDLPLRWSESKNVKWKIPIRGKAWSSPVVWDDQIWLTTATVDGKELYALCVDRRTGKILHDVTVFKIEEPQYCHPTNSYASPTPVVDEGRVYVHFGAHGTACLDRRNGEMIWQRQDFPCYHHRGPGSSPILHEEALFVHFDGYDYQYVVALDKRTGKTIWKKDRDIDYGTDNGDWKKAFGTPTIVIYKGRTQLVSPSAASTLAYDPKNGDVLWRVRHGGMNVAIRPIFGNGLVFITTGSGGFRFFAVKPDGIGDVTASHVVWKTKYAVPKRAAPVLIGDLLFMISDDGVMSCLEAKTAKRIWQKRLSGVYWASPVYADGRVFFFSEEGQTPVIEPGRTFKLLAMNKLGGGFMASPAVVGNSLILRTKTHLYCVQKSR